MFISDEASSSWLFSECSICHQVFLGSNNFTKELNFALLVNSDKFSAAKDHMLGENVTVQQYLTRQHFILSG